MKLLLTRLYACMHTTFYSKLGNGAGGGEGGPTGSLLS